MNVVHQLLYKFVDFSFIQILKDGGCFLAFLQNQLPLLFLRRRLCFLDLFFNELGISYFTEDTVIKPEVALQILVYFACFMQTKPIFGEFEDIAYHLLDAHADDIEIVFFVEFVPRIKEIVDDLNIFNWVGNLVFNYVFYFILYDPCLINDQLILYIEILIA